MKWFKENWFKLGILAVGGMLVFVFYLNSHKKSSASDLLLKCQEIYNIKHRDVETVRYGAQVERADAVIWSPKTKSCLGYYNTRDSMAGYLFEVWDYSNTDLILSYHSYPATKCTYNDAVFNDGSLVYKLNTSFENSGCFMDLQKRNIDLLTNFEKAMLELGFKK